MKFIHTQSGNKKMTKCLNCNKIVKMVIYPETGEEYYCDCQNTLEANFNKHLWELEENV